MATRVCDVPIDLDENYYEGDITIVATIQNSDSSAASGSRSGPGEGEGLHSSSSSSSGSFYDDLETSPMDLGAKWYWHSPEGQGAGYLSQSTGFEDSNSKTSKKMTLESSCTDGPNSQVCPINGIRLLFHLLPLKSDLLTLSLESRYPWIS
jgi:hypothetical protein